MHNQINKRNKRQACGTCFFRDANVEPCARCRRSTDQKVDRDFYIFKGDACTGKETVKVIPLLTTVNAKIYRIIKGGYLAELCYTKTGKTEFLAESYIEEEYSSFESRVIKKLQRIYNIKGLPA